MKNLPLLLLVPLLSGCSLLSQPPESSPSRSLPQAILKPPPAAAEGESMKLLQQFHNDSLKALAGSLQNLHDITLTELLRLLNAEKASPPPTAPAAPTR